MEALQDLLDATKRGNELDVEVAAKRCPKDVSSPGPDGWSALHLAAYSGEVSVAQRLFDAGADVNARSSNTMYSTPLHAAVSANRTEMVRVLVSRGAHINATYGDDRTPLHIAAAHGNLDIVRILVEAGADVNARVNSGSRPLDEALSS
jgi:ankyrin repeat protein